MSIIKIFFIIFTIFLLSACGGGSEESTATNLGNSSTSSSINMASKYYGSWKYVHDGSELYIISSTQLDFTEIDENQLEVNDNGITKYLIRNGKKSIDLNGTLKTLPSVSNAPTRKLSGARSIGGINVVLENLRDSNIRIEVQTDNNGNFHDSSLPAGEYKIFSEQNSLSFDTEINIENDINLGDFILVDANTNNFKTELILNDDFIYADGQIYNAIVRIHNISNVDGVGLNYTVTLIDDKLKSFTYDNVLGTLQSNNSIDIPIHFSFNPFLLNEKKIEINVKIKDVRNNEWNDVLAFKAYRTKVRLNFSSEQSNIRGYVTLPNSTQRNINLSSGYIDVPTLIGDDYYIVLSNPDLSQETAYSIGYEVSPASLNSFHDTSRYEAQNFNFEGAINIEKGTNISSYLHAGDIDFYKVQMTEIAKLFEGISNATINTLYKSNEIIITDEVLKYANTAVVNNGSIILNGVNVGLSATIQKNDKLATQLQSSIDFNTSNTAKISIGQLTSIFTIMTESKDTNISDIRFNSITDANLSTLYLSNQIILTDINSEINITTTIGTIIKNGINTNASSTIANNDDIIQIALMSSPFFSESISSIISFSDIDKEFIITTASEDSIADSFSISFPNDIFYKNIEYFSNEIELKGFNTTINFSVINYHDDTTEFKLFKNGSEINGLETSIVSGDKLIIGIKKSIERYESGTNIEGYTIPNDFPWGIDIATQDMFEEILLVQPDMQYTSSEMHVQYDNMYISIDNGILIKNGIQLNEQNTIADTNDTIQIQLRSGVDIGDTNTSKISVNDTSEVFKIRTSPYGYEFIESNVKVSANSSGKYFYLFMEQNGSVYIDRGTYGYITVFDSNMNIIDDKSNADRTVSLQKGVNIVLLESGSSSGKYGYATFVSNYIK